MALLRKPIDNQRETYHREEIPSMTQGIREQRLREALHVAGLDLLVRRLPEHVLLLYGYRPMNGMSFAFFPTAGDPVLIVPEGEQWWAESGR